MEGRVKSGKEFLDEFFSEIEKIKGVDKEIAQVLSQLYQEGKLTDTNLSNELDRLRKEWLNED